MRCKFLEAVCRVTLQKFGKTAKTPLDAFKQAFEQYYIPAWKGYSSHILRQERIWREENDVTLKRLEPILKALYTANSGKYSNSKSNQFMAIDEFTALIEMANCLSDQFGMA